MDQSKLIVEISNTLPELTHEITTSINSKNPFAVVRVVTYYTRKMIEQHNDVMIKKCLKLMGSIYTKGNVVLKNAVADVFIFSLDTVFAPCSFTERKKLMGILPQSLRNVYLKQVYTSGI